MSKELQVFHEQDVLGKGFKVYGDSDKPLFLAKDVAEWIEHSKTSIMLNTVDEDEKLRETIFTSGQNREVWFLTEEGLYEVLMQSRKPIAKQFKKQVKQILKTLRKTGGYISNADLMVNTYFGALDENYKHVIKGLFTNIEEQQKVITEQKKEIIHKEDVIVGLVDKVSLAEKRQILNKVVRSGGKSNISNRWRALYEQFEMKYHCNVKRRFESYNTENKPKMKNKLDYIDKVMGKIPELYEIACKLFENDVKQLVHEMYELNSLSK